ncbi:hypothetical protein BKA67DRAFT_536994 [Truncatella angustata]|uniref:Protein kinase domain-containing protein n=1 Tax=Truncatella angustata TaxID=152316 RepID=A0A9P8UJM3_9PEZI|nr:uncharacterized protein BKA67DRAFT_536994 [Truncatella angustata]KAH6653309.1 hypothetical protein BKA67DRAFT_536994 [Truncatella angustata]KAH8195145.1 hypothetical protein TruAng_010697 [Truncatella angustata]
MSALRPVPTAQQHRREVQWLSYKFSRYREDGTNPKRGPTVGEHRHLTLPVPKEDLHKVNAAEGPIQWKPYVRSKPYKVPDLDNILVHDVKRRSRPVFQRLQDVHTWFTGPGTHYQKVLGWGSSNLALHYKYGNADDARDFVLKVGLHDPTDDFRIRREEGMLRKIRRSHHIVQSISRQQISKQPRRNPSSIVLRSYAIIDDSERDRSSDDESVSGESGPAPKRRRTTFTVEKRARKDDRIRIAYTTGGQTRFIRESGYHDEQNPDVSEHRDFLLLEYMENGSLAAFIWKLNEQNKKCPNRVLWSFWACRKFFAWAAAK